MHIKAMNVLNAEHAPEKKTAQKEHTDASILNGSEQNGLFIAILKIATHSLTTQNS